MHKIHYLNGEQVTPGLCCQLRKWGNISWMESIAYPQKTLTHNWGAPNIQVTQIQFSLTSNATSQHFTPSSTTAGASIKFPLSFHSSGKSEFECLIAPFSPLVELSGWRPRGGNVN